MNEAPDHGDHVVLLDKATDAPIGTMEKLAAHVEGRYHSAISVLLMDGHGRQILQQRAAGKYHGGGLWSNACCSHPYPGEDSDAAAARRLRAEMNIACPLTRIGTVRYRARVPTTSRETPSLIEHEHVAIYGGMYDGLVVPNAEEAAAVQATRIDAAFIERNRERFTPWFRLYMRIFGDKMEAIILGEHKNDYGFYEI